MKIYVRWSSMVKGDLTSMNKTIIAIDGNINTGKTSLFEKFMLAYPSASFFERNINRLLFRMT